jgi:predicted nucleotidyltransferase
MNEIITRNRPDIARLCQVHGVRKLELFGSAVGESFNRDTSDFDFVVDFADRSPGYARRYLSLADSLESLLGRKVDLITERSIKNPYLRSSINATKVVVYESEDGQAAA